MANTLNLGNGDWATKENSLLGYNSENGNYKPLPFDFTRASNGTFVNKSGLIETAANGVPRIDFLGNTSGALKLEPQRTNLIPYSSDFSQGWSLSAATITSNSITSPEGLVNATTLDISAFGGGLQDSFSVSDGDVTFSLFVKKGTTNGIRLRIDASTDSNGFFDLVNNTVYSSTDDASIESYGNDWYRISISANITTFSKVAIYTTDGTSSYENGSVYIYGAQLEQGSYSTSLINTQGSAVTRVADACNNGGNDQVINSTEGVLYAEISALANDRTWRGIQLRKIGDGDDQVNIGYNTTTQQVISQVRVAGSLQYNQSFTLQDITTSNKIAILYAPNNFKVYINGILAGTHITTGVTFSANFLNTLEFNFLFGSSNFYGKAKDVRVYNTALSDAELAALTTL